MSEKQEQQLLDKIAELEQNIKELQYSNMLFRQAFFCSRFLLRVEFSDIYKEKMLSQMETEHINELIDDVEPDEIIQMDNHPTPKQVKKSKKKHDDVSYS